VHTAEGEWKVHAQDSTAPGTGADEWSEQTLTFGPDGKLTTPKTINIKGEPYNGSAALDLTLDLNITQNASDTQVMLGEIDGQAPGKFN
ncbi:flagellar basal body FlgE domain-containing protein, partial [Proteus mirabilis]